MSARCLVAACLIATATCFAAAAAAADATDTPDTSVVAADAPLYRKLKLGLSYNFSSGTYGTADTTDITYVPLAARFEIDRWTLRGVIPFLAINGPPGLIPGPGGSLIPSDGDAEGLGDIFTTAAYLLPQPDAWPQWLPFVELVGLIKWPTASRSKGLGTGEFDFGFGTELSWALGRLTPFAAVGYRFLGDPPDTDLNNVLGASIGAQYHIFTSLSAGLWLDFRQSASATTGEQLDLVPFGSWKFIDPWSLDVYASAGLATGSPDAGVGVQFGYTW